MSVVRKNNSIEIFHQCSAALDSLARGEVPNEPVLFSRSTKGKDITKRLTGVIQKIFDEKKQTEVEAKDLALFLQRWTRFTGVSKGLTLQERNKVINELIAYNLKFSPLKLIEVLLAKTPDSLSSIELRALEDALDFISFSHFNFKSLLQSFYCTYVGGLLSVQLKHAGAPLRFNHVTFEVTIEWDKIPFSSPEAITLVARLQEAKAEQNTEKVLQEISSELSSLDEESRKVVRMCALDYVWDALYDVEDQFWDNVAYADSDNIDSDCSLNPFIEKACHFCDEYWLGGEIEKAQYKEVFDPDVSIVRKRELVRQLNACAGCYNAQFPELASLYEKGYRLYQAGISVNPGFLVKSRANLPEPARFINDTLVQISLDNLEKALTFSTLEELLSYVEREGLDRTKTFLSRIFQSSEVVEKIIKEYFDTPVPVKEFSPAIDTPADVAASFLPASLLKTKKKAVPPPRPAAPKKEKKPRPERELAFALQDLSLSLPAPSPATRRIPSIRPQRKRSHPKKEPPQPPRLLSPWLTPQCIEGYSSQILGELGMADVVRHKHVQKMFDIKQETPDNVSWEVRCHTYPDLIARLIEKNTKPSERFSEHRNCKDLAYSCIGTVEYYGNKKEPFLARFTEGFFSKDNVDGKKGELYHHCLYENTSAECLDLFQRYAAFIGNGEMEDVVEKNQEPKATDVRPFSRFRVTFRPPYSCVVDDMLEQARYTLVFHRKIVVKKP